jgi:chromate reductase
MASDSSIKLLGFSGSLRSGSYTAAILRTVKEAASSHAEIAIFDLSNIPLYNGDDDEAGPPEPVIKFKEAIAAADGLVIVTPEYNYGIAGVLKNAIDWASRPGYNSVLKDKPCVMMSASPAFTGGVRAIEQLRQTLSATLARVIAIPEIVIADVASKVSDGKLTDETSLKYAVRGVESLAAEIKLLR